MERTRHQQPKELARFIEILKANKVKNYLEIGAKHGDTLEQIVSEVGCNAVAVDLPNGPWGGNSQSNLAEIANRIGAIAIFGNSHDQAVIDTVRAYGPYDAVLIDADHRYEAVEQDFYNYQCKITALHDIAGHGLTLRDMKMGVPQFWQDIKDNFDHEEIIDPSDDRPMGIGVIYEKRVS